MMAHEAGLMPSLVHFFMTMMILYHYTQQYHPPPSTQYTARADDMQVYWHVISHFLNNWLVAFL